MKRVIWCAACAAALVSAAASAQDPRQDQYNSQDPSNPANAPLSSPSARDPDKQAVATKRVGMEVQLGGGIQTFLGRTANAFTDPAGGDWQARLIFGTRSFIAAEAAYIGTAQGLDVLGIDQKATLMSNGLEAALRVNLLRGPIQPYAVAGYTWRHYRVANSRLNTSSVAPSANVNEIPVGVGMAYRFRPLTADLRATLHNAFNNNLIPGTNLSSFGVDAKLGFEF